MFAKGLGLLVNLIGVLWLAIAGGWLVYRYDRLPAGWPNYQVRCCLVVHWTLRLPDSLGARLAALQAAEKAAAARAAAVEARQATLTAQAGQAQRQAQVVIQWRTRTLIKEIPLVVTPTLDRDYPLSVGWVRAHDAAAAGVDLSAVQGAAAGADGARSLIAPSAAVAVIAGNYGACRADASELTAWQRWYADLQASQ